jgi:hypothetical protein
MKTFIKAGIKAGLLVIAMAGVAGAAQAGPLDPLPYPLTIAPQPQPLRPSITLQPALVTLQPAPQVRRLHFQRPVAAVRAAPAAAVAARPAS